MNEILIAVEVETGIFQYIKCPKCDDVERTCELLNKYYNGSRYNPTDLINYGHISRFELNMDYLKRTCVLEPKNYKMAENEFWNLNADYKMVYFKDIKECQLRNYDNELIDL